MKRRRHLLFKPLMKSLFSLSIILFPFSFALAYVPPAEYQIQQMMKKRGQKSVRVRSNLTDGTVKLKETLWYEGNTRILRGRITDEAGETVYTYQKKLGENGTTASTFLFENSSSNLIRELASEGVEMDDNRGSNNAVIGRVKQNIGWIIGKGTPSFWILKDEFLPLKWLPKARKNPEVVFEETHLQKDFAYSRQITLIENGKEVLRLSAIEVSTISDLSDIRRQNFKAEDSPRLQVIQDLLQWIR